MATDTPLTTAGSVPRERPAALRALEALRGFALAYRDSAHSLAEWMHLPRVDGNALGEIVWAEREGDPLTPVRLGRRVGLTSGATTALVNRLERLGHVVRSRESDDRRVVTLRATTSALDRLQPFLDSGFARLHDTIAGFDDEQMLLVADFATRIVNVLPGAVDAHPGLPPTNERSEDTTTTGRGMP